MWRGATTDDLYENTLRSGFCDRHLNEFGTVLSPEESKERQRKTLLFMRLHILNPLLFGKPYASERMKGLAKGCKVFPEKGYIEERKLDAETKDSIVLFDSVIIYTLCYLSKICCAAGLFMESRQDKCENNEEAVYIQKIITTKKLHVDEIKYFVGVCKENFCGFDNEFIKVANLMALLFVRELRSVKLSVAIEQLEQELCEQPESDNWRRIGNEEYKSGRYKEAVTAYTSALDFNPYNYVLFGNRAQAYLKLTQYEAAELDGRAAVMINPVWIKGYCRLASSLLFQNCVHESHVVAEHGVVMTSNNSTHHEIEALKNIKKEAKEKCLKHENKCAKSVASKLKKKLCHVEKDVQSMDNNAVRNDSDIPDLTDSSNSDESDEEREEKILIVPSSQKESLSKKPEVKKAERISQTSLKSNNKVEVSKIHQQESLGMKLEKLFASLSEASSAMTEGCGHIAMRCFLSALNKVKAAPQVYSFDEKELVHLKYSYGSACCKSGTFEDLHKGIAVFEEIIGQHPDIVFPATYYGLGLSYYKLNRFKEALSYLSKVHSFVEKGIHFTVYPWPGTTTVIEETKSDRLKVLTEELMNKCSSPPLPNAVCRNKECLLHPPIYYTDPDFKGFFSILCSEQCLLQYHPACWKALKNTTNLSDKEYLDQPCLTPDCEGVIIKVQCVGKDGNVEKSFVSEENEKIKKAPKQKKTKLEKKFEVKEQRRRKRQSSLSLSESRSETAETPSDPLAEDFAAGLTTEIENLPVGLDEVANKDNSSANVADFSTTELSVNAEPFFVLRKDNCDKEENVQKESKQKDRKRAKKSKLSIEQFCGRNFSFYNEYQSRLNKLQEDKRFIEGDQTNWHNFCETEKIPDLDPGRPFHIPEGLRNDPYMMETVLQFLDQQSESYMTKNIKETIYLYLEQVLSFKGPLHISDPELIQEVETFPADAKQIIEDNGGFKKFLLKSMRFALVNDFVCVIDDVVKAYNLSDKSSIEENYNGVHELDGFEVGYSSDLRSEITQGNFSRTNADDFSSHLNPEAVEYKPVTYENITSIDSAVNTVNKCDGGDKSDSEIKISTSFLSAVCNVPQPVLNCNGETVASENIELPSDINSKINSTEDVSVQENDKSSVSSLPSTDATFHFPWTLPLVSDKENNTDEVVRKFQQGYTRCFSEEIDKELRDHTDSKLKPHAIIEVPRKVNKCVQSYVPQVEMVSQSVMTENDDFQKAIDLADSLLDERNVLVEQKMQLEQKLSSTLDSATKFQKKFTFDICTLKKELEDSTMEYQAKKEDFVNKQTQWENEQKRLHQLLNKALEDAKSYKREMEKIDGEKKQMESQMKEVKNSLTLAEIDRDSLRKSNYLQQKKFQEAIETMKRKSELDTLRLKKDAFLKRIDDKSNEAGKRLKELHDGVSRFGSILDPFVATGIKAMVKEIHKYTTTLAAVRLEFLANVDEQMKEVGNGTPLSELKAVKMPELPEIPSLPPVHNVSNMQASTFPTQAISPNLGVNSGSSFSQYPILHGYDSNFPRSSGIGSSKHNGSLDSNTRLPSSLPKPNAPPGLQIAGLPVASGNPYSVFKAPTGSVFTPVNVPTTSAINSEPQKGVKNLAKTSTQGAVTTPTISDNTEVKIDSTKEEPKIIQTNSASTSIGEASRSSSKSSLIETASFCSESSCNVVPIELGYSGLNGNEAASNGPSFPRAQIQVIKKQETKKSYEKLIAKLQIKFPNLSQSELMEFVKEFRKQRNNKLSGINVDVIVSKVSEIIESECRPNTPPHTKAKFRPTVLVNKNIVLSKESPVEKVPSQECPWANAQSSGSAATQWSGDSVDKSCIICYEDMTPLSAYKVDCGHRFHLKCIREWLNKTSNCPICRVHLLLPEDYPSLA